MATKRPKAERYMILRPANSQIGAKARGTIAQAALNVNIPVRERRDCRLGSEMSPELSLSI